MESKSIGPLRQSGQDFGMVQTSAGADAQTKRVDTEMQREQISRDVLRDACGSKSSPGRAGVTVVGRLELEALLATD